MKRIAAAIFACAVLGPAAAAGETLPVPSGATILTVGGLIGNRNAGGEARFDIDSLRELGVETFTTSTIWTDGPRVFTGVPLDALLAAVEPSGQTLVATALNDYRVEVPVSDAARENGPILAFEIDGAPMSVRDKGPLWLVYPYDADAGLRTEVIYARSIWQLARIDVVD